VRKKALKEGTLYGWLQKGCAGRSELEEIAQQGLKPSSFVAFTARLKSCPDTKQLSFEGKPSLGG
jgi:hypothetical protein